MSDAFQNNHVSYLDVPTWKKIKPDLIVGFSTRKGGVSYAPYDTLNLGLHVQDATDHIMVNRNKLASELSFPLKNWVAAEQTHSSNIHVVTRMDKGKGSNSMETSLKNIDGLITNEKDILCTAFFADCVPLYFFDPVSDYIGIAHAGWKGTVDDIALKMVQQFQDLGVSPSTLQVIIGPSISGVNYEVDNNVVNNINKKYIDKVSVPSGDDKYLLDLKQLNYEILLDAGVNKNKIQKSALCTYNEENLFYSYRRDHGKTGRMLGFIGHHSS